MGDKLGIGVDIGSTATKVAVVGADGSITGYAGGLDRKRALLELEGVHAAP